VGLAAPPASTGQTIFFCKTDKIYDPWSSGAGRKRQQHGGSPSRSRAIKGTITLKLDPTTRLMTLFVDYTGEPKRAYPLSEVRQVNSPGSGASFKADTTIEGRSGQTVFTLFAEYDNANTYRDAEAHGDASLQVDRGRSFLLACGPKGYSSRRVTAGSGVAGWTSIYTLEYDGLAKDLEDPPEWPSTP
jgi:hypothetical protein